MDLAISSAKNSIDLVYPLRGFQWTYVDFGTSSSENRIDKDHLLNLTSHSQLHVPKKLHALRIQTDHKKKKNESDTKNLYDRPDHFKHERLFLHGLYKLH